MINTHQFACRVGLSRIAARQASRPSLKYNARISPGASRSLTSTSTREPFEEERCPSYDPKSFYPARIGDNLHGYKLLSKLGWGTGSTVWLAEAPASWWPWKKQDYVALKITNSSPATRAAARRELEVCKQFSSRRTTHPGRRYVREIINHFEIDGPGGKHLCLAFEPVRQPLWMLTQQLRREGLALSQSLKTLLPSILQCLDYLHSECHIIHTDLKGDHFMLPFEDPDVLATYIRRQEFIPAPYREHNGRRIYESRSDFGRLKKSVDFVKLTDFGLAVRADGSTKLTHDIQPREYTAPEVMLKAEWTYSADIWNLGLVLWELLADMNLLDGRAPGSSQFSSTARFAQMIKLLGPPPQELLFRADQRVYSQLFDGQGVFRHQNLIPDGRFDFESKTPHLSGDDKTLFINFAKRMLAWMPEERATAKELLNDPWLQHTED